MSPDRQDEPIFSKDDPRPSIVLVVEDEVLRFDICEFLRANGHTVLEAANVDEARTVIGGVDRVDLVFSDINMPGSHDGVELARWIAVSHPEIPIVLTSGIKPALEAAVKSCSAILATFEKPYDNEAVELQLRAIIKKRAAK